MRRHTPGALKRKVMVQMRPGESVCVPLEYAWACDAGAPKRGEAQGGAMARRPVHPSGNSGLGEVIYTSVIGLQAPRRLDSGGAGAVLP